MLALFSLVLSGWLVLALVTLPLASLALPLGLYWLGFQGLIDPRLFRRWYGPALQRRWPIRGLSWLGGGLILASFLLLAPPTRGVGGLVLLGFVPGWIFRRRLCTLPRPRETGMRELARLGLLLAAALFLTEPYATTRLVGAGDAEHYAREQADFMAQARAGIFPVYVGQSIHAFSGSVHPLRVAPYFQYAGGLLDALTARTLSPVAVQNLLLIVSFVAACLSLYAVLTATAPRHRGECLGLTLLFATSPGVLALAYGGDMFATWVALPWLPWLFYGWMVAWREPLRPTGPLLQAGSLAMLWFAHAPLALWSTLLTLGAELVRLLRHRGRPGVFRVQLAAGLLTLILSHYVFVSVQALEVPANPYLELALKNGAIFDSLQESWMGWFRAVSPGADRLLQDLHLSPGLLTIGGAALLLSWRLRGGAAALLVAAVVLQVLLVPWRGVTDRFWAGLPAFLITVTEKWPVQRFYPLLSAIIPLVGAALLASIQPHPAARRIIQAALGLAVGWSAWEAFAFVDRGHRTTRSHRDTERFLLPENNTLSRYSYEMWGYLPRFFSYGYMSPENQTRFIDPLSAQVLQSNLRQATARPSPEATLRYLPDATGGTFGGAIVIPPHGSKYVTLDFAGANPSGTLLVEGRRLSRRYALPQSGGAWALGPAAGQIKGIRLVNGGPEPEFATVRFVQTAGASGLTRPLGALSIWADDEDRRPVRVLGLMPFEAQVLAERESWLETPKVLIPGYQALIDGVPARPHRSPDGLLMLKVPAGEHRVTVAYQPPWPLVLAFWGSLVAALALLAWLISPDRLRRRLTPYGLGLSGTVALVALAAATRIDVHAAPPDLPATVNLQVRFPIGRHEVYEPLLSWRDEAGATTSVVVFYQSDRFVRIGCRKNGVLKVLTDELPVSYFVDHRIGITLGPQLQEGDRPAFPALNTEQWEQLRRGLLVTFNGHPVWQTDLDHQRAPLTNFQKGRPEAPAQEPSGAFRGRFLAVTTTAPLQALR